MPPPPSLLLLPYIIAFIGYCCPTKAKNNRPSSCWSMVGRVHCCIGQGKQCFPCIGVAAAAISGLIRWLMMRTDTRTLMTVTNMGLEGKYPYSYYKLNANFFSIRCYLSSHLTHEELNCGFSHGKNATAVATNRADDWKKSENYSFRSSRRRRRSWKCLSLHHQCRQRRKRGTFQRNIGFHGRWIDQRALAGEKGGLMDNYEKKQNERH